MVFLTYKANAEEMKRRILMLCLMGIPSLACHTAQEVSQRSAAFKPVVKKPEKDTLRLVKNDSTSYDLIVLDPGYESYLKSIARPKWYYSHRFYKTQNLLYVNEWNLRHNNPQRYDPSFYTTYIDYQATIDYGLQLDYKLYNYFQFIRYRYGIRLR